jgi:Fe-S-cluster containining protein
VNEKDRKSIQKAQAEFKSNKKIINGLKKRKPNDIDNYFNDTHEVEFRKMDCLTCSNCCKTTSPIFRDADIRRISKFLKVKESRFVDDYLRMDEEQDYVLKKSPCSFLLNDNTCSIYEVRPLACKEYPHTNRKNMHQILDLTLLNSVICPVVARILDSINHTQNNQ